MKKETILKLIDFFYNQISSSGGDGDAIWYTKYFTLVEIVECLEEYNKTLKFPWEIIFESEDEISFGNNQEWLTITNDKNVFDTFPSWIECKVIY